MVASSCFVQLSRRSFSVALDMMISLVPLHWFLYFTKPFILFIVSPELLNSEAKLVQLSLKSLPSFGLRLIHEAKTALSSVKFQKEKHFNKLCASLYQVKEAYFHGKCVIKGSNQFTDKSKQSTMKRWSENSLTKFSETPLCRHVFKCLLNNLRLQ